MLEPPGRPRPPLVKAVSTALQVEPGHSGIGPDLAVRPLSGPRVMRVGPGQDAFHGEWNARPGVSHAPLLPEQPLQRRATR